MPFKDSPEGETHADVIGHIGHQVSKRMKKECCKEVLKDLLEMAREDESDKIKLAVEYYARKHDIKI
jgi:predicted acetyltransferase